MSTRIRLRRDTAANWTSNNPTLTTGEMGYETDTGKFKIGNNTNAWTALAYSISAELSEGNLNDLKDVTITSAANGDFLRWNGTAWINDAVNLATDTIGNYMVGVTAGTGVSVTHVPGEGSDATIAIGQDVGTGQSVTFAGATIDAIKIGVTTANTIDTVSGNLTINSVGGTVTVDDNLTVTGNLTVSGTTTSINTETLAVDDNIIVLNNNVTGSPTENAGIEVERGTSANVLLQYNETSDNWELTNNGSSYSPIETTATVDTSLRQQLWLSNVYAATAAILPGSPSYTAGTSDLNGGTGIGAKLTATTNGALQIDGGPAVLNTRVLVKNQANALHNGIYKVTIAGSASATYELTRATDFNNSTFGQTTYGKSVRIATGSVNALQVFSVTSFGSVALNGLESIIHVIGTDSFTWTQVSGKATLIPGNGLQITNNDLSLPTITQSNTASVAGAYNFIQSVSVDSFGRVVGVTTNDALIELGTKTLGSYVESVSASAGTGITVSGTGEGAVVSVGSNATSANTVSTIVSRDGTGSFSAGTITAELAGNATTANNLYASKSIGLTGDMSGSVMFDGSQDVVINATIQANSIALGTDTTGNYVNDVTAGTGVSVTHTPSEGSSPTIAIGQAVATSSSVQFAAVTAPLQGNASTATTLENARTIFLSGDVSGSVSFNGSSDVTITAAVQANSVALGTDTTGNYVNDLTAGTGVTITHTPGEGSSPTVAIGQAVGTESNVTFNDLTVSGNLTVSGTTTAINTATLNVSDNIVVLNNDVTGSPTENAGIEVERGTSANVLVRYNETSDKWEATNDGTTYGNLVTTADSATVTSAMIADVVTNAQSNSYTLVLADKDKIVEMSVASGNTLTVPPNSSVAYPVGAQINILQTGAGQTTVTAGAGVTINATPGLKMRTQFSYATVIKRATDTWVLVGDISA